MNFKDWKAKVIFHEIEYNSIVEERHETLLMEQTLSHLIQVCDFMPRQGDIIHDLEGLGAPFSVEYVSIVLHTKIIEFILSDASEED
jgi:hypothetical protein